jgi:4-carboxymuconolactone decarboxylase
MTSADSKDLLGGRLPLADPSTLPKEQRELYDTVIKDLVPWGQKGGFKISTHDGLLVGPFNAFLLNPEITKPLLAFDGALKDHVSFSVRVREVIILAVGGVWASEYELYTHSIMARSAGISSEAIEALAAGEMPTDLADAELLAARVAHEISASHRIDDALYDEAKETFGVQGLYEIAALIGEFSATCAILNIFEVPVPGPDA